MIYFGILAGIGVVGFLIWIFARSSSNNRVNNASNLSATMKELQALWLEKVMDLGYDEDQIDADAFKAKNAKTAAKILNQLSNDDDYQEKVVEVIQGFNKARMKESTKDKYTRILKPYLTEVQISQIRWAIGQ